MISDNELTRLADMVQALRPEWPSRTTRAFLARTMRNRAYADLALALTAVCADPLSTTPARVEQPGPWWQAAKANMAQSTVPDPGPGRGTPRCRYPAHESEPADGCRLCAEGHNGEPAPMPDALVEVANRHRIKSSAGSRPSRDFAQPEELRQPDPEAIRRCARCNGAYIPDAPGADAHLAVFGHAPVAPAPTPAPSS